MAHDVFVSYSHKDKTVADAIVSYLEFKGTRCWYAPRDIAPGADWAASIIEAIKGAKIMVLVFTDFSNASTQVAREVNLAVSNGVTIIPFKMTESLPTEGMQYYLSTVHWLDALSTPLDQSIKNLAAQVQANLTGQPAPAPAPKPSAPPAMVVEKKRPGWLIPVVVGAAALVIAGAVLIPRFTGGGSQQGGEPSGGDEPISETADGGEAEQGDGVIETIAVPANGSVEIANPDNTGTQGNLLGNYQNDAYAASDGEWFYYRGSDGCLYKMRLDGSEKTQLSDKSCSSIGVIDGYVYYCTRGSTGYVENICRMKTDGTQNTTIYSGMLEDMMIVDGRIYFENSMDELKLYSVALDGTGARCEGDVTGLYYLTLWDGKMYWANDEDGRCLYRANYDGSEATKLTKNAVDSITVSDGWILYNDLGDYGLHLLNVETLEDRQIIFMGLYDPVISSYGLVGQTSLEQLHLFRAELGAAGGSVLTDYMADDISVCEGYIFFTNEDDGNVYMMDIYGDTVVKL